MWWLFGQLWLWLLAAFALGAATTLLLTRSGRPHRPAPPPVPAEETRPVPRATGEYAGPGPEEDTGRGRRSGTLPYGWPPEAGPPDRL
jgi:hypothetical protein